MVDGIIALTAELIGLKAVRGVEVLKLRGAAQMAGKHTFDITADGVTVYPRTEALYSRESPVVPDSTQRLTFGVKGFDDMLDGGLVAYSSTLIFGSPGSGKTSLCLSFLREGAERGESGLYFGFAESPERLIAKSKLVGTDLEPHVRSGVVALEARLPVETLPDALVQELLEKLERRQVRRLVIDGLEPFSRESLDPARTARFVSALTNVLRDRRITALFTQQTNTLFGPELHAPTQGVEAIIDNIVFLRYVELDANLRRLISILKMRESDNDSSLRELKISHRGLAVAEPFESAESILTGLARGVSRPRLTSPRRRRR
jgi:circadian clock protein KaiC